MLAYLTKFLSQFAHPLALVGLLLFFALLKIKKSPKAAIWLMVISLIIVAVLGNSYFSAFITRSMEWRHMPVDTATTQADAIILLADGVLPAESPRQMVEVNEKADRVLYAAMLYQQKVAPVIMVSGGQVETASAVSLLKAFGVPEESILAQNESIKLKDDANFIAEITYEMGFESVLLVTSAAGMDRALFLFEQEVPNVIPAPTDYQVTLDQWVDLKSSSWKTLFFNFMPTSAAFNQSAAILREYAALALYRLQAIL